MSGAAAETAAHPDDASGADEEAKTWTEVFTLFQQSGRDDRGAAYAMSMGSLRRKGEELDQQLMELAYTEEQLRKYARKEADARVPGSSNQAPGSCVAWGKALASSVVERVREAAMDTDEGHEPWQATMIADEAHKEAVEALEKQQHEQAEAEATAQAEEEAKAKAVAEAAATKVRELTQAERMALRAQGLNSRCLPCKPGYPACGYFVRTGVCKNGKGCIWDHPEPEVNSLGYPLRPGQPVCALYKRTQTCKFGLLCNYDHPEPAGVEPQDQPGALPLALAKVAAQQQQLQLLLHLQLSQELPGLQDPEAMMSSWVRFRVTFSANA